MANKASATPGFPFLTITDPLQMGIARQVNVLVTRLSTEWSKLATRANLGLPEDGSENMTAAFGTPGVKLLGATSGSTLLQAVAVASGTITFPAATDTVVLLAATQTLTNKTITSSTNTLGGVTMGLGSDATGDVYYNNGGVLTRLAKSTDGKVLELSGGVPTWQSLPAAPTQNFLYLGTVSVSGGAISDTTILANNNSTYRSFKLVFKNIVPATNAVTLDMQIHSGGSFQNTSYVGVCLTGFVSASSTTGIRIAGSATTMDNVDPGFAGELMVSNLSGTSAKKVWFGTGAYLDSAGTALIATNATGYWNGGNGAIDGVQIVASSGTLTSGSVDIYGML